jgi:hypothetical protein
MGPIGKIGLQGNRTNITRWSVTGFFSQSRP